MSTLCNTINGSDQTNNGIWQTGQHDPQGTLTYYARCRKETNQSVSVASDVTEMTIPLKPGCAFGFSYDIMYSTTGVLCGAQFALTFGGTLVSGGYGINITTIANGTVGDATTTFGAFIGSGASLAGGGPKVARIFGSIVTAGSIYGPFGGDLVLRVQPTGVGATVTVLANSTGKVEEQ